jgi:excisionase family DNA binding protein
MTPMAIKPPSKTNCDEALLTVKEVAALNQCSVKTVFRDIAAGQIEAIRIGPGGRLLRIHPRALEAYRKAKRI